MVASLENGESPPKDTTSETSGLTSADEIITATSATGVDSDESKQAWEVRAFSSMFPFSLPSRRIDLTSNLAEENRTAEKVTAYRNAMEILVEVETRNRYKAYTQPYIGFGGPVPCSTQYANGPASAYTTPYANVVPMPYTTPYANPAPTEYVTPYSNSPAIGEASGSGQSNAVPKPEANAVDHQSQESHVIEGGTELEAEAQVITNAMQDFDDEVVETINDDDEISLSSPVDIDGFLALANGGVPPGQNGDVDDSDLDNENEANSFTALDAPSSPADTIDQALSRADEDVQALVDDIANRLIRSEEPPNQVPSGNPYAAFYSTMNGKQLGAELKRLAAVARPEVNAIMPREQIQAADLFYTHLISHVHTRNAAIIRPAPANLQPNVAPAIKWDQAVYPPPPPKGYMVQWHDSITGAPTHPPPQAMEQSFTPRGNVIAPPAVRNVEEEQKVATYGFPPKPGGRSGLRSGGRRAKRQRTE